MGTRFARFSESMVAHRKRVHIAVFILTIFMIPGALTALQPIDMESYEMESPELTAQSIIDTEFPTSEIILGFVVSVRDPAEVEDLSTWEPASTIDGGTPDYTQVPSVDQSIDAGEPWGGIAEPDGGTFSCSRCATVAASTNALIAFHVELSDDPSSVFTEARFFGGNDVVVPDPLTKFPFFF